jgi:hypothetical protein
VLSRADICTVDDSCAISGGRSACDNETCVAAADGWLCRAEDQPDALPASDASETRIVRSGLDLTTAWLCDDGWWWQITVDFVGPKPAQLATSFGGVVRVVDTTDMVLSRSERFGASASGLLSESLRGDICLPFEPGVQTSTRLVMQWVSSDGARGDRACGRVPFIVFD